jgi:hypothetical protein
LRKLILLIWMSKYLRHFRKVFFKIYIGSFSFNVCIKFYYDPEKRSKNKWNKKIIRLIWNCWKVCKHIRILHVKFCIFKNNCFRQFSLDNCKSQLCNYSTGCKKTWTDLSERFTYVQVVQRNERHRSICIVVL